MKFRMTVFMVMLQLIAVGAAFYIGTFLKQAGGIFDVYSNLIYVSLWAVFPIFILVDVLRRYLNWKWPYLIGTITLGSYSILGAVTTFGYIGIFIGTPPHLTVILAIGGAAILSVAALMTHQSGPKIIKIDLSNEAPFKEQKNRLTIVHLSDIHLSHHTRLSFVEKLVEKTNALSPDIIVFTGDLIDVDPQKIKMHVKVLSKLKARVGKFAVSGNHDVMTGIQLFYQLCEESGFVCLDHAQKEVEGRLFAGIPDELLEVQEIPEFKKEESSIIFLKHRPTRFEEAVNKGVNLQLSGHSHSGQLPPFGVLVKLRYGKYAYGLQKYKQGYIFTTRGTGVWGPPMRLFSPSEIIHITL